eukprot:453450-Pyramimonas_sp.AAC.1
MQVVAAREPQHRARKNPASSQRTPALIQGTPALSQGTVTVACILRRQVVLVQPTPTVEGYDACMVVVVQPPLRLTRRACSPAQVSKGSTCAFIALHKQMLARGR